MGSNTDTFCLNILRKGYSSICLMWKSSHDPSS